MAVRAILFDIDNTLVDTQPLVREALVACGCTGVENLTIQDLKDNSPPKLLKQLDSSCSMADFLDQYLPILESRASLFLKELPAALVALAATVQLGVVTSSNKRMAEASLKKTGLLPIFEACIVPYCRGAVKPSPRPLLRAAELVETAPEEAVYIGDADKDAQACERANVRFALAGWGRHEGDNSLLPAHDLRLDTVEDLMALVEAQ